MLTLALLIATAHAELPLPTYPNCGVDHTTTDCPNDFSPRWQWISWAPEWAPNLRPAEANAPSGMSLDVAFRYSTGRWDVPVAILDSGLNWDRATRKVLLNAGELPKPRNAGGEEVDDLDGNGLLNVSDYAEDARVDITAGRDRADNVLDASDLLAAFSDGVDDDGNGYIDDIAGWDFFEMDNDVYPSLEVGYADHGTGVMTTAIDEGNDGGGLGVCPSCPLLPLRTGDTFITDGDRVALAIAYAADRGAGSIGMALGAISQPDAVRAAVDYADSKGVVLVGVAADENSWHHNSPATEDPILMVHTVVGNAVKDEDTFSFTNFKNCNNFGPRLDFVVGDRDCATGASANTAGAIGLLLSAARDGGTELSPAEARALLRTSVDEIALSADELAIARTYPSKPGFDAFFGYGRLNIGRAVQRAFEGDIPPTARLTSPEWFAWAAPDGGELVVEGRIEAPRSIGVTWVLELGVGEAPDTWTTVGSGSGETSGELARVDLSAFGDNAFNDLGGENVLERFTRAQRPLMTLRLTATDQEGRSSDERRGVWVQRDPALLPGFPMQMDGSLEASPVLSDLTGDGVLEIIAATGSGTVHALRGDGTELPGFPVRTGTLEVLAEQGWDNAPAYTSGGLPLLTDGVIATPGVGDIDGDGSPEIVVATLRGRVYAWHTDGALVDGFPLHIQGREPWEFRRGYGYDNGIASAPTLVDVDDDGELEIVLGAMDQRFYVWHGDGSLYQGYPLELCLEGDTCGTSGWRILGSPAVGDIDGDGDLDAAIGTNEVPTGAAGLAYVIDLRGAEIWPGWPQKRTGLVNETILPVMGEGHPAALALADIDGDGTLELASNAMLGSAGLLHGDGSEALSISYFAPDFGPRSNLDAGAFVGMATSPAFGDLNGDGTPDFVLGGDSVDYIVSLAGYRVMPFQHAVGAWDGASGSAMEGFPRQVDDVSFLASPAIADVSGDGVPEVLYGSGGHFVYAWDASGALAPGWPHFTGGWHLGAPAVGDIDGDGFVDVVSGVREGLLFAWGTQGRADQALQWAAANHDAQNTGNWHTPLPVQAGPPDVVPGGCCGGDGSSGSALLWLGLPLLWRRRRA